MKKVNIALICGGPSAERGISLNSARSVMDHLQDEQIEIIPIYFDTHRNAYAISKSQLYSNNHILLNLLVIFCILIFI